MTERSKGRTQQQAAAKANLHSRKTVAKYERLGRLPSEVRRPRTYRTRKDRFENDWDLVSEVLEDAPSLEAKALFEWLCTERPGKYQEGQLRTFQRRVSEWRALNVPRLLCLDQERVPGEAMQTDGLWLNDLAVTIQDASFEHVLIHSVLPYSNWEWGVVAQSESFVALTRGFQNAVVQLGHVPAIHQTDNTTAATHDLRSMAEPERLAESGRVYNTDYLALLEHFRVEPRTTHLDSPDENGDIEAANGALKRALEQHLLLRGSRDFESIEQYETFVQEVMRKRNQLRQHRLDEELEVMRPVSVTPLPEMREYRPRVSRSGTIRVLNNSYSVPSGMVGRQVVARVFEWHIEVHFAGRLIQQMPRLTGRKQTRVDYRHVIDSLLRKPGGFRRYLHREQMFPQPVFREAWEHLDARTSPRRADLIYLRILKLAADYMESEVALALQMLLDDDDVWDDEIVASLVKPEVPPAPTMDRPEIHLDEYDALLAGQTGEVAA
jgi:hypothetical protein